MTLPAKRHRRLLAGLGVDADTLPRDGRVCLDFLVDVALTLRLGDTDTPR